MITLATNIKSKATSEITGWAFNSLVNFNGMILASCPAGLHIVGGTKDNGVAINSFFTLCPSDFNMSNNKRLIYLYLGLKCSGDILVEVTSKGKETITKEYTVSPDSDDIVTVRVPCGHDQWGRWWTFKIQNVGGSKFYIYSIDSNFNVLHPGL